jgi:uncharacterized protein (TIGR01777 family)
MNILITGATGFIGSHLVPALKEHKLTVLTRNKPRAQQWLTQFSHPTVINFIYDINQLQQLNHFDAVINLAGEPIADKRWTVKQKSKIGHSRWDITHKLVELIHASAEPPAVFISGSAVGFYGDQQAHPFDEHLQVSSSQFTHTVCDKWEKIAQHAQSPQTRVCLLRTGIVLAKEGGALQKMLLPYRLGLGGPIGRGENYMPWIHMQDMVRAILFLLSTEHAHGPFNLTAPHPVTNREFSQTLAHRLGRPHILTTPTWAIRALMGEASVLLFDSIRAKPQKLLDLGFQFEHTRLDKALAHLLTQAVR